ncbi:MAG: sulfatase-like hydrolase/transferase [Saprospiraceae bacterium]|nr:sulfatase-like hydrolase/transferase [Lewinella sp.]
MPRPILLFLPIIWCCMLLASCGEPATDVTESSSPNILLIISDDQAWGDYSFMGHDQIETPRLDQLAEESLTFTRAYVTAPLCSPSLATIITGLYPHQHGITGNDPLFEWDERRYSSEWNVERRRQFDPVLRQFLDHTLLTQRLAQREYLSLQTGKLWTGSWQDSHFTHGMTHGDPEQGGRHGDEGLVIGREGLDPIYNFIEEADSLDRPFFIWYAPFLPHAPHTPPAELEAKYVERAPTPAVARYWAMCEWFDQTCGALLDHLDQKGLSDNTLVVYVCDNGWIQDPEHPNRYAERSKRSPYEGGIRTPMMFKLPGRIPARLDTTTLASSIDIVPTIMSICDLAPDETLPGVNVLERAALQDRKAIFAEAYDHDIADVNETTRSLQYRIGLEYPWKLLLPDTFNLPEAMPELFNLDDDPMERNNLVSEQADVANRMQQLIDTWWIPDHYRKVKSSGESQ